MDFYTHLEDLERGAKNQMSTEEPLVSVRLPQLSPPTKRRPEDIRMCKMLVDWLCAYFIAQEGKDNG